MVNTTSKWEEQPWAPWSHPPMQYIHGVVWRKPHIYLPRLWKRFIDDIFVIWPSIKFEAETSTTQINFLDVAVQIQGERVQTTLYTKPTDSHNEINCASCHSKSCTQGILYGQFLQLRRICNNDTDFTNHSRQLAFYFHKANYPLELIQQSFERTYLQDHKTFLVQEDTDNDKRSHENSLFILTTYHPTFHEVNKVVSTNMDLLDKSSATRPALHAKLVRGFLRCKNPEISGYRLNSSP